MSATSSVPAIELSDRPSKPPSRRASAKASLLKLGRQIHLYIGIFSAPALLFFAFSGALQTFSLHEAKPGSDYKPANWIAVMAALHKHQTAQLPLPKPQPSAALTAMKPLRSTAPAQGSGMSAAEPVATSAKSSALPVRHPLPLQMFFVVVSLGFFSSVLTGVYMSYKYNRNKPLVTGVLLAGLVIPIFLIFV